MKYTKEDIKILKESIKDFKEIKKDIDEKIKKGYTLESLYDYIRHLSSCRITNYNSNDDFMKYIDFEYGDNILVSIYDEDNVGTYLGDTIEVYNNIDLIDVFNNIDEIKYVLKECE